MSNLSQIRRSQGMTQTDLASKIGVSRSLIGLVEAGWHRPYPKLMKDMSAALGVPQETLFPENREDNHGASIPNA